MFPALLVYRLINYGKVTVTVHVSITKQENWLRNAFITPESRRQLWYSQVNYVGQYNNGVEKCNIIQIVR